MGAQWKEILRLATSIKRGTVTASLILRKLGAYPRQNSLALALREFGARRANLIYAGMAPKSGAAPAGAGGSEQRRSKERLGQGRLL